MACPLTDEQARRISAVAEVEGEPLVDDDDNEVTEDGNEEDELRHELAEHVDPVLEVAARDDPVKW